MQQQLRREGRRQNQRDRIEAERIERDGQGAGYAGRLERQL
jgi:hypothetical protein